MVQYRFHKNQLRSVILNEFNPVHAYTMYVPQTHFAFTLANKPNTVCVCVYFNPSHTRSNPPVTQNTHSLGRPVSRLSCLLLL